MVKRELAAEPEIDLNPPRSKRHKDGEGAHPPTGSDNDVQQRATSSDHDDENNANVAEDVPSMSPEEVREEGLKVLQVLRDAVNKEGRQISYDFLRQPSKRQFPDYYEIIKRPIALDDIKAQLESHAYPSLEALREDLDTCFRNARRYNQRESIIWKDAKTLQKMANKEIDKIVGRGKEDGEGSDKEGGKKKEKGVNIHRLMKNRLLKLVAKEGEGGRKLSDAFMELPSKKKWPLYYKLTKRPICIEDIFKRIKRKEYTSIPDFINDVDLVFSNAMDFNEEHSLIWEDALVMRTYFHQIMTDLPAKYHMKGAEVVDSSASPEVSHNRIRLKLPGHHAAAHNSNAEAAQSGEANTAIVRLRLPPAGGSGSGTTVGGSLSDNKEVKAGSPAAPAPTLPSTASISYSTHTPTSPPTTTTPVPAVVTAPALAMPAPKHAKAATPAQVKTSQPAQTHSQQQQSSTYTPFQHYTAPNHIPAQNFYAPSATGTTSQTPARSSTTPGPTVPTPLVTTGRTDAPSPVPPASAAGLYSVRLECCPPNNGQLRRRLALLDETAGVRNFALRVPITEPELFVRNVKFALHEVEVEESENEEAKTVQTPRRRGRGRPKKVVPIDQEIKPPEVPQEQPPAPAVMTTPAFTNEKKDKREWRWATPMEVEVKLDGQPVTLSTEEPLKPVNANVNGTSEAHAERDDCWSVNLAAGQHVLEVARKGNDVPWRVYLTVS